VIRMKKICRENKKHDGWTVINSLRQGYGSEVKITVRCDDCGEVRTKVLYAEEVAEL